MIPDEVKKFKIKYTSKTVGQLNAEIFIQPRCGVAKTIQTPINVIQPKILVSKEELNMGVLVVNAIVGQSNFTLTNDTEIEMPLIFDLRPPSINPKNPKGIQNLVLKLINSDELLETLAPPTKYEPEQPTLIQNGQNLAEM